MFIPDIAYVNPVCKNYPVGKKIIAYLEKKKIPIIESRRVLIEGKSSVENYSKAKKTLYITVNKQKKLPTCKPSADYQFSLSSSCPGHCEYCYLQTTQGEKPYLKLFVNIDEIMEVLEEHIKSHLPKITTFESGSITDPVALEHLSGNLAKCITFFGQNENGRLRVITKYAHVDTFLKLEHNGHTKFRFSINTPFVIDSYEHGTDSFEERINGAKKIGDAGYPVGFIIAPIMIYDGWKQDYKVLIEKLSSIFKDYHKEITFELIQHRFTKPAKELIMTRFPKTSLDMDEEKRQLKWGPYGKFKYVYPKESSAEMKAYMTELIQKNFSHGVIEYFT